MSEYVVMSDIQSAAREAAQREVERRGLMNLDFCRGVKAGAEFIAGRMPDESEIADCVAQFWAATDTPVDAARAILALIEKKMSG